MSDAVTVNPTNRAAPNVYTNRLAFSQAWFDALFGVRSRRSNVPRSAQAAPACERPAATPAVAASNRALDTARATAIARRTNVGAIARVACVTRRVTSDTRQARIAATPVTRAFERVIILHGRDGVAITIAYSTRGLAIAARGTDARGGRALERAREALVAHGIVHRTFTASQATSEVSE